MSTNASSLRRILRSIGSRALPASDSPRASAARSALGQKHGRYIVAREYSLAGRGCTPRRQLQQRQDNELQHQRSGTIGEGPLEGRTSSCTGGQSRRGVGSGHCLVEHGGISSDVSGGTQRQAGIASITEKNYEEAANNPNSRETQDVSTRNKNQPLKIRKLRSRAAGTLDAEFEDAVRSASHRERDGAVPSVTKDGEFSVRYYESWKGGQDSHSKRQMRRRQIHAERHDHKEREWQDILHLLEHNGPSEPRSFAKRVETIRLPEGVFAMWTRDPGRSILQVMQQTGSHVQVILGQPNGAFPALTLFGTPEQNMAAKQLLQDSGLLQAISEDDLNASKSLADYNLRMEADDLHTKPTEGQRSHPDKIASMKDDSIGEIEDLEQEQLESAVDDATFRAPTRAVWSRGKATQGGDKSSHRGVESVTSSIARATPVAFTAQIEDLTAVKPRLTWRKELGPSGLANHTQIVRDELVRLLTRLENAPLITTEALSTALQYLAHHMFFPAVRNILNTLDNAKLPLNAQVFDPLLEAAARAENVHSFHYLVYLMKKRNIQPTANTWVHFHTLMFNRFPADTAEIIARMREVGVHANNSARINTVEEYAGFLLQSYLTAYPNGTVADFIKMNSERLPGLKWMTAYYANRMITVLLQQGKTSYAFNVVDELVRRGGAPSTVTLNIFLSAANKDGNLEMAVATLKKFHDLRSKATPFSENEQGSSSDAQVPMETGTSQVQASTLQHTRDVSVIPNRISFKQLLKIAWDRKSYNTYRVFWRYACCAGQADSSTVKTMRNSMRSHEAWALASNDTKMFAARESSLGARNANLPTRRQLWEAWAGRLALGVQSLVVSDMSLSGSPLLLQSDEADSHRQTQLAQTAVLPSRAAFNASAMASLNADLDSVRSVRPAFPLAEMAEAAWQKDRQWKSARVGLPQGLKNYARWKDMYDVMLRESIEVPLIKGDGTATYI